MNKAEISKLTNMELKREALQRLGQGVLPFEQWANVFANPKLAEFQNLKCKAFSVWFTTPIDYIKDYQIVQDLVAEAAARKVALLSVPDLASELNHHFAATLSLFSRDEQIFMRDRRLQCVHGVLNQYSRELIGIDWFDNTSRLVVRTTFTADEYTAIVYPFYVNMQEAVLALLGRTLASPAFAALGELYSKKLKPAPHLVALTSGLGLDAGSKPKPQ